MMLDFLLEVWGSACRYPLYRAADVQRGVRASSGLIFGERWGEEHVLPVRSREATFTCMDNA